MTNVNRNAEVHIRSGESNQCSSDLGDEDYVTILDDHCERNSEIGINTKPKQLNTNIRRPDIESEDDSYEKPITQKSEVDSHEKPITQKSEVDSHENPIIQKSEVDSRENPITQKSEAEHQPNLTSESGVDVSATRERNGLFDIACSLNTSCLRKRSILSPHLIFIITCIAIIIMTVAVSLWYSRSKISNINLNQPNTDADKCSSNPCKYGGKCVDADSYNCQCAPGYEGKHCDHKIGNLCLPNPCKHNGSCVRRKSGYVCKCSLTYKGQNCETEDPVQIERLKVDHRCTFMLGRYCYQTSHARKTLSEAVSWCPLQQKEMLKFDSNEEFLAVQKYLNKELRDVDVWVAAPNHAARAPGQWQRSGECYQLLAAAAHTVNKPDHIGCYGIPTLGSYVKKLVICKTQLQ